MAKPTFREIAEGGKGAVVVKTGPTPGAVAKTLTVKPTPKKKK